MSLTATKLIAVLSAYRSNTMPAILSGYADSTLDDMTTYLKGWASVGEQGRKLVLRSNGVRTIFEPAELTTIVKAIQDEETARCWA